MFAIATVLGAATHIKTWEKRTWERKREEGREGTGRGERRDKRRGEEEKEKRKRRDMKGIRTGKKEKWGFCIYCFHSKFIETRGNLFS